MDLSGLKWPIIILLIAGIGFLFSPPGTNFLIKQFTKNAPGQDAKRDAADEAGLSRIGGFLLKTFRYNKAFSVLALAVQRYPEGRNAWYNKYRMVKCAEKMKDYNQAVTILEELIRANANEHDKRVPKNENLKLRCEKLVEMHELRPR